MVTLILPDALVIRPDRIGNAAPEIPDTGIRVVVTRPQVVIPAGRPDHVRHIGDGQKVTQACVAQGGSIDAGQIAAAWSCDTQPSMKELTAARQLLLVP